MQNSHNIRVAGLLYLIVVITGIFSLGYIPKRLIDWNDSGATFKHIHNSLFLFRLGIYSSVICYMAFTFLPLFLYKILKNVHQSLASAMVILALLSVPIAIINLEHEYAVLMLVEKASFTEGLETSDLHNRLLNLLERYNNGISLTSIFWGLWLFPFGLLVYKSGFMPRILGILLVLGCIGYLVNFTGNILVANYSVMTIKKIMRLLPAFGEFSICVWLLLFNISTKKK